MRAAVAVLLAGCGRIAFDTPDAIAVDAAPARLDTILVPGLGTPVQSRVTLEAGVTYELRVSGTFYIAGGVDPYGDAEYWDFANGARDKCDDGFTDAGLAIDDPTVDDDKQPHWGPYRPDHLYVTDFVGKGAPISATIHDVGPSNNAGELTLEVWSPAR